MPNLDITNIDNGHLQIGECFHRDDTLTFAGADTLAAGTILARDSVSENLVIYVKGGVTNENGVPKVVLPYEVVATGASNVAVRVIVGGVVNATRLIIDADGDATNIDAPVLDQLRSYGIVPTDVAQLGALDNQ